ncbi:hypothetical protein FRACYDRAFT_237870 [Fragilariopsis cylindrus CCMP1102]|uniref:Uncharacterized protein n=1 Tax=Fragilariopsis cylindrus CCMP1102 TaxID=635003 RepID=A0A1E7FH13_9STRA|nr:hypothetical protein FRACYDRAFT_237870 [Fragilariopsis cylindrus CCMP1102]|eukprot:OEU17452.1 hypothetical protein FRACYDRAFT_237870 [Fragilariopsis cylindrus CCMP1102]
MGLIPHNLMPVGTVRPYDILILLAIGAIFESATRILLLFYKRKPDSIRKREYALKVLEQRVKKSRALGPPSFVETSKLERQMLAEEKKLTELAEKRTVKLEQNEKLIKNLGYAFNIIVLFCWYGVPVMEFSGERILSPDMILSQKESQNAAISAFDAYLFPLSYLGIGVKISKLGLANPRSSTGALLVVWAAQTTVGKIMDGVEALCR